MLLISNFKSNTALLRSSCSKFLLNKNILAFTGFIVFKTKPNSVNAICQEVDLQGWLKLTSILLLITYVKKYNDEIYYLSNEKKKEKTHIVVGGRLPGLRCVGQKWL